MVAALSAHTTRSMPNFITLFSSNIKIKKIQNQLEIKKKDSQVEPSISCHPGNHVFTTS